MGFVWLDIFIVTQTHTVRNFSFRYALLRPFSEPEKGLPGNRPLPINVAERNFYSLCHVPGRQFVFKAKRLISTVPLFLTNLNAYLYLIHQTWTDKPMTMSINIGQCSLWCKLLQHMTYKRWGIMLSYGDLRQLETRTKEYHLKEAV